MSDNSAVAFLNSSRFGSGRKHLMRFQSETSVFRFLQRMQCGRSIGELPSEFDYFPHWVSSLISVSWIWRVFTHKASTHAECIGTKGSVQIRKESKSQRIYWNTKWPPSRYARTPYILKQTLERFREILFHFYLNNRVFLSRNYRLIVAPRKFDVLTTNICPRSEASRANMLV